MIHATFRSKAGFEYVILYQRGYPPMYGQVGTFHGVSPISRSMMARMVADRATPITKRRYR